MKKIALLGSTGSIGKQTLDVIRENRDCFTVETIASFGNDLDSLQSQINEFQPKIIAVYDTEAALQLKKRNPQQTIISTMQGVIEAATYPSIDIVVSAISGTLGLLPTYKAIEAGKTIALANKEVLVSAGELVMRKAKECHSSIIPLDSEHNAIFQCLQMETPLSIKKILLTASGGPFRDYSEEQMKSITLKEALAHPTYSMGKKNSIDSSTLMNKGLEIIEACWLFSLSLDQIEVVIHPQSIIHSMVTFVDGSTLAQMSYPDMKIPIRYALHYPHRAVGSFIPFDFSKKISLDFYAPDMKKFPCLRLALEAFKTGKSMPCFMNAANEELVSQFVRKEISWQEIPIKLEKLMSSHTVENVLTLDSLLEIDQQAKEQAKQKL